jgi:predicted acyl esterase
VPISGISDLYKYNFVNGVHIDIQGLGFNTYYWLLVGLAPAGLSGGVSGNDVPSVPGAIAGEACTEQVDVQEGGVSSTLDGNKDAYWQERDFLAELQAAGPLADGRQRAAVWYIHGLQDWNVKPHMMEDWLDGVWAEGVPTKVWLGQWPHAWPAPTGADCDEEGASCRADWWSLGLVAWFDQFLKGMDTGILDAPAVQVQDDDGVWRSEDVWPAATDALRFYFDAGALRTDGPGSGSAEYTVATAVDVVVGTSVTFVSEPLEGDLHLSGLPLLRGNITASGDRASLVVSLGERGADGDRYVNFAAQSLNHVGDLAAGRDSVAGVTQDVSVRFFPQDDVLHAGNRILVTFAPNTAGGPGPGLIPIQDLGTITLDLASLRLVLPIDATIVAESEQPYVGLAVET